MSVKLKERMLYKSNIYITSAVLTLSGTSEGGLFLVPDFWVLKCLLCLYLTGNGRRQVSKSRHCKQASPY